MNEYEVIEMAKTDAAEAIAMARASGPEPIVWITGNSHMPPLRAFGQAEKVWQYEIETMADWEVWDTYVWTLEQELDKANVYLDCPEYDNELYVVDLNRFQYIDDNDAETLSGEWAPKAN